MKWGNNSLKKEGRIF